jgi:hypothetical protein
MTSNHHLISPSINHQSTQYSHYLLQYRYDLSPFLIEVQRTSTPFFHFFTKACAIVGGVISVMGVVDSTLYRLQKPAASGKSL